MQDVQDIGQPDLKSATGPKPLPLTELPVGGTGVVTRIEEADHAMLIRLKTMGMYEGRIADFVRHAPAVRSYFNHPRPLRNMTTISSDIQRPRPGSRRMDFTIQSQVV